MRRKYALQTLSSSLANHWTPKVEPRGWQAEALALWKKAFRGVVRVVTGGGKTIFAHLCIAEFRKRYPNGRVIVIVPTSALLDQWVVSFIEDLSVPPEQIACYSAMEKPAEFNVVNVLVINTARLVAERIASEGPAMLVVDECHRAGSVKNALALKGRYVATLGLSATPERQYDNGFEEYVAPVLGEIIYSYDYVRAARDNVISPFVLKNVRVEMLDHERAAFAKLSSRIRVEQNKIQKGIGSEEKLKRLLHRRAAVLASVTMRIPVAVKLAEQHLGEKTIIFHERVEAANTLASILRARQRSVSVYHAGIAPGMRRENLRFYRKGIFDILVCCRALDEGINVPETSVAILASSTASLRQRVQRLGRVLRPAEGKSRAIIYTIYASDMEEQRLVLEAEKLGAVCEVHWLSVKTVDGKDTSRR